MTVSLVSPISPNRARSRVIRVSRSSARRWRCASSPSSQAMRNWRPLMVTLTCGMALRRVADSALVAGEHGADGIDRSIESLGDFAVGALQGASAGGGGIKLGGEPRAVGAQRVQLGGERRLAPVGLAPALDRGRERVECKCEPPAGR